MPARISATTFDFLRDLKANNNRDWFQENRHRYDASHREMIEFAEALFDRVSETDVLEIESGKKILFRIYRDVRFSKNKAPYKINWAGRFRRATDERRGGLYFHVAPDGGSFVGGGFWRPEKEDLLRIRKEIAADDQPFREVLADSRFQQYFGSLEGDQLKTAPKGFDKEHPAIDLLRYKQYLVTRSFSDEQVLSENFLEEVALSFEAMGPFFDYMSEVLTTDANGRKVV